MHITYFANDLSDAAVARRVDMLRLGGARVAIIGFRRTGRPVNQVGGVDAIDLGQTYDARFLHRALTVLRQGLSARRWKELIRQSDVLLARNLEMAVIADCARIWSGASTRLAYECLDIHGLLLRRGLRSKMLRGCEKRLLRRSSALIVSSPGFLTHYFDRLGVRLPPVIVAENKRMPPATGLGRPQRGAARDRPPWRVGWFGILRCTRSFAILHDLALRHPALVDVELRGRPTRELQSLIDRHLPLPNMRFRGPYALSDLDALYGDRDLTWAVELWQSGGNADWLLPNRIYEGGYFNCPAIALAGTETARWLTARGAGVVIQDPDTDLETFITTLTPARCAALKRSVAAIPTADLVYSADECRHITGLLCGGSARAEGRANALA